MSWLRKHFAALLLLCVLGGLLFASMREESPTTDEPVHLTRGLAFFWSPDTRLSYAHPPFGNALAALPVALTAPRVEIGKLKGYARSEVEAVSRALLTPQYEQRRQWFFTARGAVAVLVLLFATYFYSFCLRLWGQASALAALFFLALHPTLIAHGRLVTTDVPVAIMMFVALGELTLFLRGRSWWHVGAAGVFCGLSLATKYTAIAVPLLCVLMVSACAAFSLGRYRQLARRRALGRVPLVLGAIGVLALLTLQASFKFDRPCPTVHELLTSPEPQNPITRSYRGELIERESPLAKLPGWLPVPLPYSYVVGLVSVRAHDRHGHPTAFFGEYRTHGTPLYFPLMLLIKTPFVMLVALGYGLFRWLKGRCRSSLASGLLLAYAGFVLGLAMTASINIGVRHVMPVIPALAALAGRSVALAWTAAQRWGRARVSSWGLAALCQIAGACWSFPDYLSDFNVLVGGRWGGEKISIVGEEWGQDMIRLGRKLAAHGVRRIAFNRDSFTPALELARFGVGVESLPCGKKGQRGYVAVNARDIARDRGRCLSWTKQHRPLLTVGAHIFVYDFTAASRARRGS